jgi:hypothetical protein
MEGSWTFAGCVISDSKAINALNALFYTKDDRITGSGRTGARDFATQARLVPNITRRSYFRAARPGSRKGEPAR